MDVELKVRMYRPLCPHIQLAMQRESRHLIVS